MSNYALINTSTNIVENVIAIDNPDDYTPASGYIILQSDIAAIGWIYDPVTQTVSAPPVTKDELKLHLINNIAIYGGLLSCSTFTVDPTQLNFGILFPKIFNENTTDTRTIIDASGDYQTVTNQNIIDTYNVASDNYQKQLDVIKAMFADIDNDTLTTYDELDTSMATYASAVSARTNTNALT